MPTTKSCEIEQLLHGITEGDLPLPAMPAQAVQIQKMIDDINVSAEQIVKAISGDPSLVAQLLKSANGSLYADKPKVDNVRAAVSRLGFKFLRNLIMVATLTKMDGVRRPAIRAYLDAFWEHSREVAAISHFLVRNHARHLDPNQAVLIGLVHDIGTIPICMQAEKLLGNDPDAEALDGLIRQCRTRISVKLLSSWEFQPWMVEAVAEHENFHREAGEGEAAATYADVLTVANQLAASARFTHWSNVPAAARLGLVPEQLPQFPEAYKDEWRGIRETIFQ